MIVADANVLDIAIQQAGAEVIIAHPGCNGLFRSLGACPVSFAHGSIGHAILAEDGELALAIGTDVRIAGGELLCTSLSGIVQVLAADGHGRNASLCTLHVDQLQELLALAAGSSGSRCCKSGYDAQHNNAEHHFQNIVLTHIQDSSLTMLQKKSIVNAPRAYTILFQGATGCHFTGPIALRHSLSTALPVYENLQSLQRTPKTAFLFRQKKKSIELQQIAKQHSYK